jgi:hypothetical protein
VKLVFGSPFVKFFLAQKLFQLFLSTLVFLVTDHGNASAVTQRREIQPGSAAAVAFRVSEALRDIETKDPDKSDVDALVVVITEAFVHHVLVEDVKIAKAGQYGGICH